MATATASQRCHCFFSGRVQGVGFRYKACNLAINYNVAGFVRNLSDGRVELVAEGPDQEVCAFVDAVRERLKSHIRDVERLEEPASGNYSQFVISR